MKVYEDYIFELTTFFFIRKKMIITIALFISLAAVLITYFIPPTYAIVSHILVRGKRVEKNLDSLESTPSKVSELNKEDLNSEIELLTSHDVIRNTVDYLVANEAVFREMNLDEDGTFQMVKDIKGNLESEIIPNSNVIHITLKTKVPHQGLIILENHLEQYLAYRSQIYTPSQADPFFNDQLNAYKKKIIALEGELNDLVSKYKTPDPFQEIENNLMIKQDLVQHLNQDLSKLIQKQREVRNLKAALENKKIQFFTFIDNLSITSFADKLQGLVIEKGALLRKFHPESTKVFRVEEQIQNTYAVLKAEVTTYLSEQENQALILKEKVASMESRVAHIDARNIDLHIISMSYQRVKNELDLMQSSYKTLMRRWEETIIQRASDTNALSLVSISSKPFFSGTPVFPNKRTLIPVGIMVGLITGFSLSFLSEYFDQRIKRPEDIHQFLDKPTLFSIPKN